MEKYILRKLLYANVVERWGLIEDRNGNKFKVHFMGDYANSIDETKEKEGDILEGTLYMDIRVKEKEIVNELFFKQSLSSLASIEAIIEVSRIIDEYRFYAFSTLQKEEVRVMSWDKVELKIGEKIYVEGTIELDFYLDEW